MDFKKIVVGTTCAIGVATVGLGVYFGVRQYKFKKFMEIGDALPVNFKYTAHTGCMGTNDNSLESIDAAVANGADIVEFDLNFTESGEPVLAHDAPKGGEVTLDEAFKKVSEYENIMVNVDIKSTVNLPIVRTLAEKYGIFDRIFFTGVNDKFLDAVRSDGNGVPYYLNVDVKSESKRSAKYIQSLVDKVKNSGAIGINFNKKNATAELVKAFHNSELLVSIWTVDDEYNMYRILSYAPDNITTRNPDMLKEVMETIKS